MYFQQTNYDQWHQCTKKVMLVIRSLVGNNWPDLSCGTGSDGTSLTVSGQHYMSSQYLNIGFGSGYCGQSYVTESGWDLLLRMRSHLKHYPLF